MGPKFVVIKKGENMAPCSLVSMKCMSCQPFRPEKVLDPTGAGDSFAGGMMGHLASLSADSTLRR